MKTPDTELSVHEMTPQTGTASRKTTTTHAMKGVSFAKADVVAAARHEQVSPRKLLLLLVTCIFL